MVFCTRGLTLASGLLLSCFSAALPISTTAAASDGLPVGATIRHHDLFVQIDPDRHELVATDRMTLELPQAQPNLTFTLAPALHLDRLVLSVADKSADESSQDIPFEIEPDSASSSAQHVKISAAILTAGKSTLTAHYHGFIDDPPKEPRHLRFVTPSETAGHIGPEGVYLSSESQWYLDLPESLSTHRLRVALPSGWTAVTQGKPRTSSPCPSHLCPQGNSIMTEWDLLQPSEALTLVANRFVSKTREWTSKSGQSVQLAAYLFPDDAHLADEYLDATARYLDAYIQLLGPYPFDSFAVVENFFASGLGMPSFTLLGSGTIKRHYVQPYALGHEIVHSWIGNAVFNQIDRGNWVEGLTTYLANYYWHEQAGDAHQAREQRRMMLAGYNLHAPPDRDYPLGQFSRKRDERDNAIGYQKAAMVFHLLRREIGEDAFWTGLKRLVTRFRGRYAEWSDLEQVFTQAAGRDLRWFFAQWIEAPGAPELAVQSASARVIGTGDHRSFQLKATIDQTGRIFRLTIPVTIKLSEGGQHTFLATLDSKDNEVDVTVPDEPASIELDPDSQVIRRVPRESLPPVLNHFVTDRQRTVLTAFSDPTDGTHPFRGVVTRIEGQDAQKPETERAAIGPISEGALLSREGSVLVLASPDFRGAVESVARTHCGDRVELREGGVILDARAYEGPEVALLANCHRKDRPGSVVTLLYAETPQAAKAVSRLLFFYGWSSYLVFKNGNPIARGEWETAHDRTEVRIHGRQRSR